MVVEKLCRRWKVSQMKWWLVLLLISINAAAYAYDYPAKCRVTTTLNVRQGPGTDYYKIGKLYENDYVVVESVTWNDSREWGVVSYYNQKGYVAMQYVSYVTAVSQEKSPQNLLKSSSESSSSWFDDAWTVIKVIFIIILLLVAYAYKEELMAIAAFVGICMGIGALVFWWLFDNASLGATVGFWFSVLFGLRIILEAMGADYANVFEFAYRVISFPFWFLNRLQLILMEPWRYLTKGHINSSIRNAVTPWVYPAEILLYILITPLRLVNAIYYNIFVYGISELYDLILEVIHPSDPDEGEDSFWGWIVWLPVRLVKYPLFNGCLVLLEGMVWTVIDILIPTITMYHGTDLTAAQAIVGNDQLKGTGKKWTDGTFCSSSNGWAGAGAYFGSSRQTARVYACDGSRLSDNNPVMIVCRVSLGKILNYRLAPSYIHDNTGPYGNHSVINQYAVNNGYVSGEWWNYKHSYWEYCMFDWKNRYNYPWRIRPIYVFNFRTGLAQHIDRGFRHWLFSKAVIDDILNSTKFTWLVIVAALIVLWFLFYGYSYLWNEYLWYYFL